ncbi:DUF722 domain-containing protein [Weissella tructae]
MADKYDGYMREYFSGKLDLKIQRRKSELKSGVSKEDRNSSIRAQNVHENNVELSLIREEEDDFLEVLEHRKQTIETCMNDFSHDANEVFIMRYHDKKSWNDVYLQLGVMGRTGRRWCEELRNSLKEHI